MKVKCIDDRWVNGQLQKGKIYEVDLICKAYFTLMGTAGCWFKDRFEIVNEQTTKENTMTKVNYHVLPNSLIVNFNGATYSINKEDARFKVVLEAIKAGNLEAVPELVNPASVFKGTSLELKNGLLWLDGESLPDALSDRVIDFQKQNIPFSHLVKFAKKLKLNPSFNSRQQLFKFLEHNGHPITTEGNFIAYRGVTENFKDKHTQKFDNSVGSVCEMPREQVDDNPNNTCSHGLHVACFDYAQNFGSKVIEVEVDPQDVVCVPTDYNGTKMRVCKFKVVNVTQQINNAPLVPSSYSEKETTDIYQDAFDQMVESENDQKLNSDEVMIVKNSSAIKEIEYNYTEYTLKVTFASGATKKFEGVPNSIWKKFKTAPSKGKYFNQYILGTY